MFHGSESRRVLLGVWCAVKEELQNYFFINSHAGRENAAVLSAFLSTGEGCLFNAHGRASL